MFWRERETGGVVTREWNNMVNLLWLKLCVRVGSGRVGSGRKREEEEKKRIGREGVCPRRSKWNGTCETKKGYNI